MAIVVPPGTPFVRGIAVGEAGVYADAGTVVPPPVYANLKWASKFDNTLAFGAWEDFGVHNGVDFKRAIPGIDSQGFDFGVTLKAGFNCVNPVGNVIVLMLGGNNIDLVNIGNYVSTEFNTVTGPGSVTQKSAKNTIITRGASSVGSSQNPQVHIQIRRGSYEGNFPTPIQKFYHEFWYKLDPNMLAKLSSVSSGYWVLDEWKTGFSWNRPATAYDYGLGDYRVGVNVLQSAGALRYRVQADSNANGVNANFTASISGSVMTVSAIASNTIQPGMKVSGGAVAGTPIVLSQVTGTPKGGVGTYNLSTSQPLGSTAGLIGSDPNGTTSYWFNDYLTVIPNVWTKYKQYVERPTDKNAVGEGRTWISITPESTGVEIVLCDRVGQAAGAYQMGSYTNQIARILNCTAYSDGLAPFYNEICDLKWYDGYPYGDAPP